MSFQNTLNNYFNTNIRNILLQEIRENWHWILLPYNEYLQKKTGIQSTISKLYEPYAISSRNFNKETCLFLHSLPEANFHIYAIKNDLIEIINIFFNTKIIFSIQCHTTTY